MSETLSFEELEQVYDLLAATIDQAGPERETLVLGKLAILLAHRIPDIRAIEAAMQIALREADNPVTGEAPNVG